MNPTTTATLTLAQAFSKADLALPPNAELLLYTYEGETLPCWICLAPIGDSKVKASYRLEADGWELCQFMQGFTHRYRYPNLANLPAADALEALPKRVQKVLA